MVGAFWKVALNHASNPHIFSSFSIFSTMVETELDAHGPRWVLMAELSLGEIDGSGKTLGTLRI